MFIKAFFEATFSFSDILKITFTFTFTFTNQVINEGLNLIHLATSINSLIGGKLDQNKQHGGLKFCDIVSLVE